MTLSRRTLVKSLLIAGGAAFNGVPVLARSMGAYPFRLGIASGDPWPDGFVLWTRLATDPLAEHGGMPMAAVPLRYEVSDNETFRTILVAGEAMARPETGHSVHAEIFGLRPGRRYWYRFICGADASSVGTVKTAPAADAPVQRVRIANAGCQRYEDGLYTAWRYLAQEEELDAVFHYGDYIYEYSGLKASGGRPAVRVPAGGEEIYSLDDYRRRYAQVKTDPDLQAAHAAVAFLPSVDDHEVADNWAGRYDESGTPSEAFLVRRAAALQAWYENMPVRRAQMPSPSGLRLYRRLSYGRLLDVHLLDTRQFRDKQRCSVGQQTPCRTADAVQEEHLLGAAQEEWFGRGLSRGASWNLLAQQVMFMPFVYPKTRAAGRINQESWNGYPDARRRVIKAIADRNLTNVVIASGDSHKHFAGNVPLDERSLEGEIIATEFLGTSISSEGDGEVLPSDWKDTPGENPNCKLIDARRGYQVFTVTPKQWRTELRILDRITRPGGKLSTLASFEVDPHRPGIG